MSTTPLRGIECPDRILIPVNEPYLLNAVQKLATSRELKNIQKVTLSLRHKFNVAMYQAALICNLNPNHYTLFEMFKDQALRDIKFSDVTYKICTYSMGDIDEYLLTLSFLIETFAATIFSLFDISGSLINQIYKLEIMEESVSFHKAFSKLQEDRSIDPNGSIFRLLCSYDPKRIDPYTTVVPLKTVTWMKPLKELRNHTTHRPITDVCDVVKRGDIHSTRLGDVPKTEFWLNDKVSPNKKLADFAKEVFGGIEEFIEDFYFYLGETIQRSSTLPIY